jgi:hypothetical protein
LACSDRRWQNQSPLAESITAGRINHRWQNQSPLAEPITAGRINYLWQNRGGQPLPDIDASTPFGSCVKDAMRRIYSGYRLTPCQKQPETSYYLT